MCKSTVIQIVLIILGIISFYQGLGYFLGNFLTLFAWFTEESNSGNYIVPALSFLIVSMSYLVIGFLFVKNFKSWSDWITERSDLVSDIKITASPNDVLYFLFVIVGAFMLLKEIPFSLDKLFTSFEDEVRRRRLNFYQPTPKKTWIVAIMNVVLPILTILFARNLATYFSGGVKKNSDIELRTNDNSDI
jgi:hypothetical protein